ncbi:MAG: hypothetical protein IT388_03830 [Nitrospirales bacterium]|nr:hypothetical protein [Nitrospirales bacterium]
MALLCPIERLEEKHELVICDSGPSMKAHKELFRFSDEVYLISEADIVEAVEGIVTAFNTALVEHPSRMHLVLGWSSLLKTSLWKPSRPDPGDVFALLRTSGAASQELQPFKNADIDDLFPWLYYGKRFDILRKLCHATKKRVEGHLKDHSIRVDCHLFAEETGRIVASSL